jgi:hypothetical protein
LNAKYKLHKNTARVFHKIQKARSPGTIPSSENKPRLNSEIINVQDQEMLKDPKIINVQ